tara:strand:+ start:18 stop:380 length:363 start_codon:yes stop_codon:yes gene_type:complete
MKSTQLRYSPHDAFLVKNNRHYVNTNLERMGAYMHLRLTCDLSQEQIDGGYDMTLLTVHSRFVDWLLGLELPIVGFHIFWAEAEGGDNHMFVSAELLQGAEFSIDVKFLDELHLGGNIDE